MATTEEYARFVCGQAEGSGDIRCRKMFGEYMIYVDDRPVLLVCDNTVFVKKLPETEVLLKNAECGFPYDGAKERYILDIDDKDLTMKVIAALVPVTPLPKPRRKKHGKPENK